MIILVVVLAAINLLLVVFLLLSRNKALDTVGKQILDLEGTFKKLESGQKEEFRLNREEASLLTRENRKELAESLKLLREEQQASFKTINENNLAQLQLITSQVQERLNLMAEKSKADNALMRESLEKVFKNFQESFDKNVQSFNNLQREKFSVLEEKQNKLVESTEKKLEQMRETVDEKLQKTLNERLGHSFEMVNQQLKSVQEGLGEMRTLATDVGGLKKVLSNVKTRGGIGEVQLAMLLEQLLAPDQFEANVRTKKSSSESVEFALKLPGREDNKDVVYLPIDAKFPKDRYEKMLDAYESGEPALIDTASKELERTIKQMAADIHNKYIDPPNTTDFAIMFLPFEGIFAEVVRRTSLLEQLQRDFKVIVTGPTTLAAILNSLQMGFRTLAIQKRSSEVWQILGAVKKEFENFGGMLEKAQKNIQTASNQIDEVMGKRTRAIQRKLKSVETLEGPNDQNLLSGLDFEDYDEEEYLKD